MALHLVTGVAGFIGSHLAERLVGEGNQVIGIDRREGKVQEERHLECLRKTPAFCFVRKDLRDLVPPDIPEGTDTVFHLAGRAGVRSSWDDLEGYLTDNVIATQRVLEAALKASPRRVVLASSSSVYGDDTPMPAKENALPGPLSPYAVSKLAAESLAIAHWRNFGTRVVILRYFTVYGPRQRPDMAFSQFAKCLMKGEEVPVFGDGLQKRDFTFIDDAVEATVLAGERGRLGEVYNVGSGREVTLLEAIELLEESSEGKAAITRLGPRQGESRRTWADISKAVMELGYSPRVHITEGIERFMEWFKGSVGPEHALAHDGTGRRTL
ncbi:MAG: NAD-dependent epimerase/dehydratase family protein [Bacillota bacterium]